MTKQAAFKKALILMDQEDKPGLATEIVFDLINEELKIASYGRGGGKKPKFTKKKLSYYIKKSMAKQKEAGSAFKEYLALLVNGDVSYRGAYLRAVFLPKKNAYTIYFVNPSDEYEEQMQKTYTYKYLEKTLWVQCCEDDAAKLKQSILRI